MAVQNVHFYLPFCVYSHWSLTDLRFVHILLITTSFALTSVSRTRFGLGFMFYLCRSCLAARRTRLYCNGLACWLALGRRLDAHKPSKWHSVAQKGAK